MNLKSCQHIQLSRNTSECYLAIKTQAHLIHAFLVPLESNFCSCGVDRTLHGSKALVAERHEIANNQGSKEKEGIDPVGGMEASPVHASRLEEDGVKSNAAGPIGEAIAIRENEEGTKMYGTKKNAEHHGNGN